MTEKELKKTILEIIDSGSNSISGIGRKTLLTVLKKQQMEIGEGILRKYMNQLKEDGLIQPATGRAGTRITEKGRTWLQEQ